MLSYTIFIYFTGKQAFLGQSNVNTYFESDIYTKYPIQKGKRKKHNHPEY